MFASNFPVDSLCATFADDLRRLPRDRARLFAPSEQRALFRDNAIRIYAIAMSDGTARARLRRRRPDGPADGQAPGVARLRGARVRHRAGADARPRGPPARAAATSPADAARDADFVLLNLPTTEAVEQAVFGDDGVASALAPPQLVVDFSTVKVDKGRAFAARLRDATGCGWIDAPVSGRAAGVGHRHADGDGGRRRRATSRASRR